MDKQKLLHLIEKAQSGEKDAFGKIYELTGKQVYFNCLKLTGDESTAKDVLQDTYLTAFERLKSLQAPENFLPWINRIAINNCKAHFKNAAKTQDLDDEFAQSIPDDGLIPEDFVDNNAKRKIIMDIIDNALSSTQRQTVILYYYNNMSISVIANIMECPEGTVLSRLNSARLKLREAILIYEKENNDRLHAVMPIGILGRIFEEESKNLLLPNISFAEFAAAKAINSNQKIVNNTAKAGNFGGKVMLGTLKAKIIAGVSALVIVGGAITAGVIIASNDDNDRRRDDDDDTKISAELDEDEDDKDDDDDEDGKDRDESSDKDDNDKEKDESSDDDKDEEKEDKEDKEDESSERDEDEDKPSEDDEPEYPEFEGLEVFELITYTEERDGTDEISGTIVDAYNLVSSSDNSFVLLDDEGSIYYYYPESTNPVSYSVRCIAENTSITKFDDIAFDYNQNYFVALDGRTFYAKAIDDASLWSNEDPTVTFEGEGILYEEVEDLEFIKISQSGFDLYAMDSTGFWHAAHAYYDTKYPNPVDGIGFYHNALDTFANLEYNGIEAVDMIDTSFALSDKGQLHEVNVAADDDIIENSEDYVFVDVFDNCTEFYYVVGLGLTDDNKIVAITEGGTVVFEEECPEGTLENVWMSNTLMTVKTDTGYYTATIASRWDDENVDTSFHPCDALNNVADQIVRITNHENVLLSNGYLYDYNEDQD